MLLKIHKAAALTTLSYIFLIYRHVNLSKYRHGNSSPNLVPGAKNPGSGSPPIMVSAMQLWIYSSFKTRTYIDTYI